ncbi:MAG: thiamine diphosphokinase [Lachnospiraceae bacterium]|nr:thiamine diphosphokinase [Lachnospiraceae bacterium]
MEQQVKTGKCIIMAAGDFTPVEIDVKDEDYVIAADGGFLYCSLVNVLPDMIVGDMDSVDSSVKAELLQWKEENPDRFVLLPTIKDDTDTLAAIRIGLEKGYRKFHIYGAMGGRLEHSMANIQCLTYLKENDAVGYLMDASCMVTVIKDEAIHFNKNLTGYLSVFSLGDQAVGVNETGLKYTLDQATVTNAFPVGISNEFIGEEAVVSVEKGTLLVIVSWAEED